MKQELPKLPHGMGSYSYYKDLIRYKKRILKREYAVYGKTIREVNSKMKELEQDVIRKKNRHDASLRTRVFEEGMKDWLERYKMSEVTAKSYDRIEQTYKCHILNSNLGRMQEQAITSDNVQDFMNALKTTRNTEMSYSSKKKVYELLCQYFRFIYDSDPTANPMRKVTKPKKDNTIVKEEDLIIWDDDEISQLREYAYEEYYNGVSGVKYGLLVTFLMYSFLRVNELFALQWKDIDFSEGTVNVYKQISRVTDRKNETDNKWKYIIVTPKKNSVRKFILPKPALNAIKEYYDNRAKFKKPDDWICSGEDGKRFTETRIRQTYQGMKTHLGLDKPVTIHGLRHTGISYLLRHGVPIEVVSRMAGHRDISITQNIYYSVIKAQKDDAIKKFNEQFDE